MLALTVVFAVIGVVVFLVMAVSLTSATWAATTGRNIRLRGRRAHALDGRVAVVDPHEIADGGTVAPRV